MTFDKRPGRVQAALLAAAVLFLAPAGADAQRTIEKIRFEPAVQKKEGLFITLSSPLIPDCFPLEGEHPRVVCDFPGTLPAKGLAMSMEGGSGAVRKVRVGIHRGPSPKTRIVLDLARGLNYDIEQIYVEDRREFVVTILPLDPPP